MSCVLLSPEHNSSLTLHPLKQYDSEKNAVFGARITVFNSEMHHLLAEWPLGASVFSASLIFSPILFLALCRSKFLTYAIFLLSKECTWTFLVRQVYWQKILSISVCQRSLLLPHFWRIVSQDTEFRLFCCFFALLKLYNISLTVFLLAWFLSRCQIILTFAFL